MGVFLYLFYIMLASRSASREAHDWNLDCHLKIPLTVSQDVREKWKAVTQYYLPLIFL